MDTLVGYNVYRETELYRFQTETSLYHTPAASNCGEDFVCYNGGESFWMHVTAVYNSTLQESDYIDSAYCYGYAVGIIENINQEYKAYPNPFTTSTTIEYELTEPSRVQLTIYNAIGGVVYVAQEGIKQQGKHTFTWTPERLPDGMYYGVLRSEEGVAVVKLIKQ
ncbi:MAG: T9SS type A sorting domain-containing protein [Bacteroidales bacterium]|nr:T9SS type A sorting domain-containing protein [Bacteroidales bacterium]